MTMTGGQTSSPGERCQKKRKILRELKGYTGEAKEDEPKFKGWSDKGKKYFHDTYMGNARVVQKTGHRSSGRCVT